MGRLLRKDTSVRRFLLPVSFVLAMNVAGCLGDEDVDGSDERSDTRPAPKLLKIVEHVFDGYVTFSPGGTVLEIECVISPSKSREGLKATCPVVFVDPVAKFDPVDSQRPTDSIRVAVDKLERITPGGGRIQLRDAAPGIVTVFLPDPGDGSVGAPQMHAFGSGDDYKILKLFELRRTADVVSHAYAETYIGNLSSNDTNWTASPGVKEYAVFPAPAGQMLEPIDAKTREAVRMKLTVECNDLTSSLPCGQDHNYTDVSLKELTRIAQTEWVKVGY